MLLVAGIFGLVACGPSADETTATEAVEAVEEVTEEAVEAAEEATEELADHVCPNDRCTEDACHYLHGEKSHTCGEDCTKAGDGEGDGEGEGEGEGESESEGEGESKTGIRGRRSNTPRRDLPPELEDRVRRVAEASVGASKGTRRNDKDARRSPVEVHGRGAQALRARSLRGTAWQGEPQQRRASEALWPRTTRVRENAGSLMAGRVF